jgi:hypothetical protein
VWYKKLVNDGSYASMEKCEQYVVRI